MAAKITKPNTCPLGLYPIKSLPIGEYVRRVDMCKQCSIHGRSPECDYCGGLGYSKVHDKTYTREAYDALQGSYPLSDCDNANRQIYLRGNVLVLAGFTY